MLKNLTHQKKITVEDARLNGLPAGLTGRISPNLRGYITGLRGNISSLTGDITGLTGEITGLTGRISPNLRGDITGLTGDATDISGNLDECEISETERASGVDIADLRLNGMLLKN